MIKKFNNLLRGHIKDFVYAASDGIVTTFVVVAGFVGAKDTGDAETAFVILLVIGFASLFADGFSMATGNYLGTRSESDQHSHEKEKLSKKFSDNEKEAIEDAGKFLKSKGFSSDDSEKMAKLMTNNKSFLHDLMIYDRLGIVDSDIADALRGSIVTLVAFLVAGIVPLIPYVILSSSESLEGHFLWACILTGIALFSIGALRTTYSDKTWLKGGLEMLILGGLASVIAYLAGYITSLVV